MRLLSHGNSSRSARRPALDSLHGLVDAELRIHLHQHVDVVRHNLHLDDVDAQLGRDLRRDLLEAPVHALDQYAPAILRAPYHVVLARVDDVVVALVLHT